MTKYGGSLKKRIDEPNIIEWAARAENPKPIEDYRKAVAKREKALFKHFGITPKTRTAWRDLALALAAKHVTAYRPRKGKPRKNFDEDRVWIQLFALVKFRDDSSDAAAFKVLAEVVQKDVKMVTWRLKEFKKERTKTFDVTMKSFLWLWTVSFIKSRDILGNEDAEQIALEIAGADPEHKHRRLQQFRVSQAKAWDKMRLRRGGQTNIQPFLWSNEEIRTNFKGVI